MPRQKVSNDGNKWKLPFGFFAGPILWGLQIVAGYGLVTVSCATGGKWPVYLTLTCSSLIVLAAAIVTYQTWKSEADEPLLMTANQEEEGTVFWAVSGFIVSLLFFVLILATAATAFFLTPCPVITMQLP